MNAGGLRTMLRRMRAKAGLIAVALTVALVAAAVAETASLRVFGRASKSGTRAMAAASGVARRPAMILVRVRARPSQRVSGAWMMVCSRGGETGTKSGILVARTPFTRRLQLALRNPTTCTATANAQLGRRGRVTVILLKR